MEQFYHKHYIRVDDDSNIVDSWSDGPHHDKDISGAICINERGGWQFRLEPDGEENPQLLHNDNGVPLYKWDGETAIPRAGAEIQVDI